MGLMDPEPVDERGISPVYALAAMAAVAILITLVVGAFFFGLI